MNQGTRIVVAIVVILMVVTGIYWITAGPKKTTTPPPAVDPPAGPAKPPATTPNGTGAPRGSSTSPAGGSTGRPTTHPAGGSGFDRGAKPVTGTPGATSSAGERVELGGGARVPSSPSAGGSANPGPTTPTFERALPMQDVGGKGDLPDVGNFVRRPVGPFPSLANMPAGFVPADSGRAAPGGPGAQGAQGAPANPPTTPASTPPAGAAPASAGGSPLTAATPPRAGGSPPSAPAGPSPSAPGRGGSAPSSVDEYVVQDGDTLTTIADMWFGDGRKWQLILAANDGVDPTRLQIGQKLKLPGRSAGATSSASGAGTRAASGARPATTSPGADGATHVVAEGDTLYSIAKARLGDGLRWEEIYEANRAVIGADPKVLKVGTRLKLTK